MNERIEAVVEYTDTFGGEANYSWVRRKLITLPADADGPAIRRAAKRAMRLTGIKGVWADYGDLLSFQPWGSETILYVSFVE